VTGETGATGMTVVAGGIDETGIVGATDIVGFFSWTFVLEFGDTLGDDLDAIVGDLSLLIGVLLVTIGDFLSWICSSTSGVILLFRSFI